MIRMVGLVAAPALGDITEDVLNEDIPLEDDEMEDDEMDQEPVVDPNMGGDEGRMIKAQLRKIFKQASELYNMVGEDEGMEAWAQDKLSKAADYINSIHNFIDYEKGKSQSLGDGYGSSADPSVTENVEEDCSTPITETPSIKDVSRQLIMVRKIIKKLNERGQPVPQQVLSKYRDLTQILKSITKSDALVDEKAPGGWEGTVKAMKKHKEIDNPFALAQHMKKKGYTPRK